MQTVGSTNNCKAQRDPVLHAFPSSSRVRNPQGKQRKGNGDDWRRQRSMSIRFQPKSRASTDHTPGPSRLNAAPIVASNTQAYGFFCLATALPKARITAKDPAIGVHNPATRSKPAGSASRRMSNPSGSPVREVSIPSVMRMVPATNRISSRPRPGPPPANVENKRRNVTALRVFNRPSWPKASKGCNSGSFELRVG